MGLLAGFASSCRKEWEVFDVVSSYFGDVGQVQGFQFAILRVRTEIEPLNPKP